MLFFGCSGLTGVEIPEGVTEIGPGAFSCCSGLTGELRIPEGVKEIGDDAFSACSGLTGELKIPSSVEKIGREAFAECSGLTGELKIPSSVEKIGDGAFAACIGLTSIVAIDNENYASENGVLFDKNLTKLIIYPAGKTDTSYTIPEGVKEIGDYAFSWCCGLTGELRIPEGVTKIGNGAFNGYSRLKEVVLYEGTEIGEDAFPSGIKIKELDPQTGNLLREYNY